MPKYIVGVDCAERQFYTVDAKSKHEAEKTLRLHLIGETVSPGSVEFRSTNDPHQDLTSILADEDDEVREPSEQARYEVAVRLERVLGSDDFQLGPESPVEFVDGGAWVTTRVWVENS